MANKLTRNEVRDRRVKALRGLLGQYKLTLREIVERTGSAAMTVNKDLEALADVRTEAVPSPAGHDATAYFLSRAAIRPRGAAKAKAKVELKRRAAAKVVRRRKY